ncbi:MAG: hypothetical protein R6U20_13865 [Longimonas sp.]|uniref:hypothetical protein n=1 Tax=Longimonas sp. TaxID=2039626 RepID=UPI003976BDC2
MTASSSDLRSPTIVTPREADVVDGTDVRFEWEPVEGADHYILQVAESARFDTIVLEENVGSHTSVGIADFFPTDERTFFWRVLSGAGDTVSESGRVESFVAADAEAAEAYGGLPEQEEDMGPAFELVRSSKEEVPARVITPDARLEREKEIGVAEEGIATGQIAGIAFSIIVVIAVAVVVLFAWTNVERQQARSTATSAQESAAQETNDDGRRQISEYAVVDEEDGTYRIPIDRAIDLVVDDYNAEEAGSEDGEE